MEPKRTEGQNVTVNTHGGDSLLLLVVEVPPRVENVGIISPDFRDAGGMKNGG